MYKNREPRWVQASPLELDSPHAFRVYYQCLLSETLICNPQTKLWKLHTLLTYLSTYLTTSLSYYIFIYFPLFTFLTMFAFEHYFEPDFV